ncbi:hypothetical protein VTJ83DRAFT_329 [Remersonia thermophila]|uniref:Nucleolar protein 12 n=1 Tax=Remersonia thermophila TaxID=72144 RepID=A0ABR4DKP1_9PEZI
MAKGTLSVVASSKAIDPSLDALFSQSAGPAKPHPKSRYEEPLPPKSRKAAEDDKDNEDDESDEDHEESSEHDNDESEAGSGDDDAAESDPEASGEGDEGEEASADEMEVDAASDAGSDASSASSEDDETQAARVIERAVTQGKSAEDGARKRKRKRKNDDEELEAAYLERLAAEDEPSGKRRKSKDNKAENAEQNGEKAASKEDDESGDESGDEPPVHESLTAAPAMSELEKANRTVFLSNVSVEAITSRKAKKTLLRHLSSVLDRNADPPQKIESIRFRSTAFESAGIPKRAAYIKKEVMAATTKSTNAYVVYSTQAAARIAVSKLNGTIVLDRHLRVDSVAHPAPVDHRRCVFVGNLGFVDDESVYTTQVDEEGKEVTTKRKRTKEPADVEEGLWRVFGEKAGKVENVRVVRDPATRVGKGFAYVQFYDGNSVEAAILLNGKKFPPMLPRELRVTRCKAPQKTARAMESRLNRSAPADDNSRGKKRKRGDSGYVPKPTAELQTLAGRASKLLGRFGAAKLTDQLPGVGGKDSKKTKGKKDDDRFRKPVAAAKGEKQPNGEIKGPEQFVFEGRRASARDGKPKDLKFKVKNKSKKKDPHLALKKKKKTAGKAGKK